MKRIISTSGAPLAGGPYSQGVEVNGTLFISGQVGIDPAKGKMVEGDIKTQAHQVLRNIGAILKEAGYNYADVVKSTVFLSDISDFSAMNEVYATYYSENQPARSAFAVKQLPLGALIEIETIAMK